MAYKLQIFNYSTPQDLLKRLNRQLDAFNSDSLNEDKALDFCLTAWSIADWVYYSQPRQVGRKAFRANELFPKCKELEMMHDIANGTKHFELSAPILSNKISSLEADTDAAFSTGFSYDFNRPALKVKFENGDWSILHLVMEEVHSFWNQYLT